MTVNTKYPPLTEDREFSHLKYFGGQSKFEKQCRRDVLVRDTLKYMGIPLIEVRYDEKNPEEFLLKELGRSSL